MLLIFLILSSIFNVSATQYSTKTIKYNIPGYKTIHFERWVHPLAWNLEDTFLSKPVLDKYKTIIPEGSVVIDIGAHIGDSSVAYAVIVGPKGRVFAFEPSPNAFEILKKNAKLHPNIIPIKMAITDKDGVFNFSYAGEGLFNGVVANNGSYKVAGVNLENWLKKNYPHLINKVKFIKIDTEGYDRYILKSIKKFVERYKPALQMEVFMHLNKAQKTEFYKIIQSLNYKCFLDDHKGFLDKKVLMNKNGLSFTEFINLGQSDVLCFSE